MSLCSCLHYLPGIVGPRGIRAYIRQILYSTYTNLTYKFVVHEIHEYPCSVSLSNVHHCEILGKNLTPNVDGSWDLPLEADTPPEECFSMVCAALKHSIPCYGFVLKERDYPGKMQLTTELKARLCCSENKAFCLERNIANPMSLLGELKGGRVVEVFDGKIAPGDVLGPARKGRKITILGDTCESTEIAYHAYGSTYLVHEGRVMVNVA